MTERLLAHEIVVNGETFKLHSVRMNSEGALVVEPFSGETSGTLFIEGRIEVWIDPDNRSIAWRKVDEK